MNPYQAPAPNPMGGPRDLLGEDCPKCHSTEIHKPSFTWWGGALGPRMLNHRVCRACGFGFNEKTRQSNRSAITIYMSVMFILTGVLFYYLRLF